MSFFGARVIPLQGTAVCRAATLRYPLTLHPLIARPSTTGASSEAKAKAAAAIAIREVRVSDYFVSKVDVTDKSPEW